MPGRCTPPERLTGAGIRRQPAKQRAGLLPEDLAVPILVRRVKKIETAEERIGRKFCRAKDIPAAIDLRLAESKESVSTSAVVAPDPALNMREHAVKHFASTNMHMLRRPSGLRFGPRLAFAEIAIACIGSALVISAIAANQRWLDRHFLPDFFISRTTQVRVETDTRIAAAVTGFALAIVMRRPLARFLSRDPLRTLLLALAVVSSFGVVELALRRSRIRAKEEVPARNEPRRQMDAQIGWLFVPRRSGYQTTAGRRIEYVFDRNGYRVRSADAAVDFERPTIVFSGESMMVGERLSWDETIPAQTGSLMHLQSANVAVSGFANDQAYLRLKAELSRFSHPVAVVTLFSPALFDRNLDDDRPWLDPGLVWHAAENRSRLMTITRRLVRYRSDEAIERGIAATREVLRAGARLARARGAVPLIVVPQFGEEQPREIELRHRILDQSGLRYVWIPLDPAWRVPGDGHPDARGAHAIAVAIANRLLLDLREEVRP